MAKTDAKEATAPFLNADMPITVEDAERLGRMDFVRLLARRVLAYKGDRALVIGVCGPWGSGKTSIVNLLVNEIQKQRSPARLVLDPVRFTPCVGSHAPQGWSTHVSHGAFRSR